MKYHLQRVFILIFILGLMVVPGYWISRKGNFPKNSLIENRELQTFPEFSIEKIKITAWLLKEGLFENARVYFLDPFSRRTFQNDFIQASTDHFPLRIPLTRLAKLMDRVMIQLTYAFLPDKALPTDAFSGIYITRDEQTTFKGIPLFNAETTTLLNQRMKNLEDIANNHPDINVYLFYFDNLAYSIFDPRLPHISGLDGGRALNYVEENLPNGIHYGKVIFKDLDDQNQFYYLTDHHLNIHGEWKVYQELYDLLSTDYPGIIPKHETIKYLTFPGLEILGTYARDSLYPFEPETFEMGLVELPPHKIIHSGENPTYTNSSAYLQGEFDKDPYAPHYQEFFGENVGYVIYNFENNATKNLLLFGSSNKIPVQPWIASHYKESYFVNLRIEDTFSLDTFLEEYHVDDLVILTDMNELLDPRLIIQP